MKEEEENILFEWLKHENNIFSNRGNFFLLAETAFLVMMSSFSGVLIIPTWILFVLGIIITIMWILVNFKHVYGTQRTIANRLKDNKENIFTKVRNESNKFPWSNHTLLGILLPFTFLALWIILLFFDCRK